MKLIDKLFGLEDKREWREMEKRRKALPHEYNEAFKAMRKYMWTTGAVSNWPDSKLVFNSLLDMLEEAANEGRKITEVTGPDVAKFCDDLSFKSSDWKEKYRQKLNAELTEKK